MAEPGALYDGLLLTYSQTIGTALRAADALLEEEERPRPKLDALLKTIEETLAKMDALLKENPNLEMYREGYGDALRWVLTLGMDDAEADEIRKVLDS